MKWTSKEQRIQKKKEPYSQTAQTQENDLVESNWNLPWEGFRSKIFLMINVQKRIKMWCSIHDLE